jgi:hypothetical protein
MSDGSSEPVQPTPRVPNGYTCQHTAIAISLRIALVEYYERAALIAQRGRSVHSSEELESRRLTIVLLSAALCEACINLALALTVSVEEFEKIERKSTLAKWFDYSKRVTPGFSVSRESELGRELVFLFNCRDSITHAKAEIFSEGGNLHKGNHDAWSDLNHVRLISIARLPVALLRELCASGVMLVDIIHSGVAWQLCLPEIERSAVLSSKQT